MKKIVIIISVTTVGIIAFMLFQIYQGYNQNVAVIEHLDKKFYPLIEQEFFKLPKSAKIESVALTTGKDACLVVKLLVPEKNIAEFQSNIGFETEPDVVSDYSVEKALKSKNTSNYMKILFSKVDSGMRRVDLVKYEPLRNETWDLMKKAGFRSLR